MPINNTKMTGRRDREEAREDVVRIVSLLAEEGGGKSQYQISNKLKDIGWATLRRDLGRLREGGFISVKGGPRGAILHNLTGIGFLFYLASVRIPSRLYVSKQNEDVQSFAGRLSINQEERQKRFRRLVEIIEREAQTLGFPLFSEIRILFDHLGEEVISVILSLSRSSMIWSSLYQFLEQVEALQRQRNELKSIKEGSSDKFGDLSRLQSLLSEVDERGAEIDVFEINEVDKELGRLDRAINDAKSAHDDLWQQIFLEHFFSDSRISDKIEQSAKTPNEKIYRSLEEALKRKKNETKILRQALNLFKE